MSNKLKQITTKAKQLYKTGKFAKWTDAIKAASGKVTKTKKVGALPIGFSGSFWGVKFKVVNQFDIYGDVNSYVETLQTGFKIVTFDGKGSAADKAQILFEYVLRHGKPYGVDTEKNRKELKSKILSFCTNMQKEV